MTPEGKVKAVVKRVLKEIGAYQHWPVQTGMGAPCLDCHGCYKGKYFAIETKAPGKLPTARQYMTKGAIEQAGGIVLVTDNADYATLKEWIQFHLRSHNV
jgi:hypothetical protein